MSLRDRFDVAETTIRVGDHAWTLEHPRSAEALISEPDFERDERLPYWADIWPSARVLADVLVRHQGDGRTALELGCGSGLVACALACAGYRLTATDYYEDALAFTAANVLRATGVSITTRLVDWRQLPRDLGRFDLVVGADVLYERGYGPLVADALAATIGPRGVAFIADPGRVGFDAFLQACRERRLSVDEAWTVPHALDAQRHDVRIVTLVRDAPNG
ncbi:MAG: methyltransferase domain-containing protein [Gemmatimonadaceae bacterium]|nr:methyltransferase domain-containing protein [Gemmatimonadaceae bacterium]